MKRGHARYVAVVVALSAVTPAAQDQNETPRGMGYAFVAPGVRHDTGDATVQAGGGGEYRLIGGLGIGADLAWLNSGGPAGRASTGVFTLFATHGWRLEEHPTLVPFAFGGLAIAPAVDSDAGVTWGGGVNAWVRDTIGMRVAFRDDVYRGNRSHHYFEVVVGVTVRGR